MLLFILLAYESVAMVVAFDDKDYETGPED